MKRLLKIQVLLLVKKSFPLAKLTKLALIHFMRLKRKMALFTRAVLMVELLPAWGLYNFKNVTLKNKK